MTVPSSLTLNDARRRCHAPACDEPGEAACGSDVIAETPGRPPRRYPGVLDNVAMNGIKDAVAGQRHNADPRVRFLSASFAYYYGVSRRTVRRTACTTSRLARADAC